MKDEELRVRAMWRRIKAGKKSWDDRGRPYTLPVPWDYVGHHPTGCVGPRGEYPRRGGRRWMCGSLEWCAYCWQRAQYESGLLGLRDHLGLTTIHWSARPFAAQTYDELASAKKATIAWAKDQGASVIALGLHAYGESMLRRDWHFDVVMSGEELDTKWMRDKTRLAPLEDWQRSFLRGHGGYAYSARVLPDGRAPRARAARHHAVRYALRCTVDVPRLWCGLGQRDVAVYDLRGNRRGLLTVKTREELLQMQRDHVELMKEVGTFRSRLSRRDDDQARRHANAVVVAESAKYVAYRWRLEQYLEGV